MKKSKFRIFLLLFGLFGLSSQLYGQIPDEIVRSIRTNNVETLATYFNQNVELVIQNHDDVFSKSQARQIVAEFFKVNKPQQFTIISQRGNEGAFHATGSLVTRTGNFRVYFLLKNKDKTYYIHQLRIVSR
jgi:hypothetical protein